MRRILIAAILLSSVATTPVIAQSEVIGLRVDKLEKEMKAVQRKVFPNGVALEPEIGAATPPNAVPGSGASAPITDLTARVDALESQLRSMTGQIEQNGFRLKKAEDSIKAMEARLKAVEPAPEPQTTSAAAPTPAPVQTAAVAPKPVAAPAAVKPTPISKPATPKPVAPPPIKADPARKSAIAAVEIPSTGDAAEDAYTYGFRLWTAKLYPEAQTKLKEFVGKYPSHRRASYAQNLLGRAYLDEGKPALASVAFYDNYTKNPKGERAPESLSWLGVSLLKLKKPTDACRVFSEFDEVYGSAGSADNKARVSKGKVEAKCQA